MSDTLTLGTDTTDRWQRRRTVTGQWERGCCRRVRMGGGSSDGRRRTWLRCPTPYRGTSLTRFPFLATNNMFYQSTHAVMRGIPTAHTLLMSLGWTRTSTERRVQGYLAHKTPHPPVGPYSSPMPRDLWWPRGGGWFLMSKVPQQTVPPARIVTIHIIEMQRRLLVNS